MLEETQRPRVTLEPLDDYVVVEPSDDEAETRHGLIIPASAEAGSQTGIVIATGADPGGVEPGDKVLFPRGAGFDVRLAGTAVKVMRRGELRSRVHDGPRNGKRPHLREAGVSNAGGVCEGSSGLFCMPRDG